MPFEHSNLFGTLIALVAMGGCLGASPPSMSGRGVFPLEVANEEDQAISVRVSVQEPHGGSTLLLADVALEPGERSRIDAVEVPHGPYRVRADTASMGREVEVVFGPTTHYVRLVIHADVIAYETG